MRKLIGIGTLLLIAYVVIDLATDSNMTVQGMATFATSWTGGNNQ